MNFGTMIADTRTVLKDEMGLFITDDDIRRWLNEAQRDLSARLRLVRTTLSDTVDADSLIPLPTGFLQVSRLELTDQAVQVDDDVFTSWFRDGGDPGVILYRVYDGALHVYPDATGEAFDLEYAYIPDDLAANSDESPLPLQLHPKMVAFARAHAHLKDGSSLGPAYMQMYEQGLPQPSIGTEASIQTPLILRLAPGPFDGAGAAHH